VSWISIAPNVVALGAVADFVAQNCQATSKADARHNVQLTTKPAIEPNVCYALVADFSALNFNRSKVFVLFCVGLKNILLFSCVYHIYDVYLYQQNR